MSLALLEASRSTGEYRNSSLKVSGMQHLPHTAFNQSHLECLYYPCRISSGSCHSLLDAHAPLESAACALEKKNKTKKKKHIHHSRNTPLRHSERYDESLERGPTSTAFPDMLRKTCLPIGTKLNRQLLRGQDSKKHRGMKNCEAVVAASCVCNAAANNPQWQMGSYLRAAHETHAWIKMCVA